jgi:uncharacterized protein (DUF1501 family)
LCSTIEPDYGDEIMLDIGSQQERTCNGLSRRACLRIGTAGLFGLSLPNVLAAREAQAVAERKDVNCIVLWMGGGPSNLDTFDMKPDAPAEYRGEFRPIASNVPGLEICEHLPHMSRHMDKVCMLRSVTQEPAHSDHVAAIHYMMTGYPQRSDPSGQPINSTIYPSFGSVVSRERGWRNNLPPYVLLSGKGGVSYHGAGYMGAAYNPLSVGSNPNDAKFNLQDASISEAVGVERTERRREMLAAVDRYQKANEGPTGDVADRNRFYQQAYDLITSPSAKRAFRLDDEPGPLRDRYGRTRDGQACLLARRLVEAGVRFVTVPVGSWDTHQDNFKRLKGELLPPLDLCWSALLDDLAERGMLSNTLVVWVGDFGRTPKVNGSAGRDHWSWCSVIGLSGCGIKMGTVVGRTDKLCERPTDAVYNTHDFAATIYHVLGIDGKQKYRAPDGRPHLVNNNGQLIREALA